MSVPALSYSNLGRNQVALDLYEQTLDLRKRLLGDEHPNTHMSNYCTALVSLNVAGYSGLFCLPNKPICDR